MPRMAEGMREGLKGKEEQKCGSYIHDTHDCWGQLCGRWLQQGLQGQLLHNGILQGQVVSAVDQQLVLQVLRRMEVFAGRLLTVATTL